MLIGMILWAGFQVSDFAGPVCPPYNEDCDRLAIAWRSDGTTESQRQVMSKVIEKHTLGKEVDWSAVRTEYFAWHAEQVAYDAAITAGRVVAEEKGQTVTTECSSYYGRYSSSLTCRTRPYP